MGVGASVLDPRDESEKRVKRKIEMLLEKDDIRQATIRGLNKASDNLLKRIKHERDVQLRPSSVRVRVISAIVPRGDFLSESDTYIVVRLGEKQELTRTIRNDRSPEFDEYFEFKISEEDNLNIHLEAWDRDRKGTEHDPETSDFLGRSSIDLSAHPVSQNALGNSLQLIRDDERSGSLTVSWASVFPTPDAVLEKLEKDAAVVDESKESKEEEDVEKGLKIEGHHIDAPSDIVIRKNVLDLSDDELKRFLDAVREMMKPIDGKPQTGEYFRLAGYHGWPGTLIHLSL
jgi:hypothetical protein